MTNDPPASGEESPENEVSAETGSTSAESGRASDFASRPDPLEGMPAGESVWRETPPVSRPDELQELVSVEDDPNDEAATDDADPADSVIDELDFNIAKSVAGDADPPFAEPAAALAEEAAEGATSSDGPDEPASVDTGGLQDAALSDLRQRVSHTYLTPKPMDPVGSVIDPAANAGTTELDRRRDQFERELSEDDGAPEFEVTAPDRGLFSLSKSTIFGGVAATTAVVAVVVGGSALLGGSDEDPAVLPADTVATEAPAATTATGTAGERATDATPAVVASTDPADHWVIDGTEALSDAGGDLWIVLSFANPWGPEPPTTGFEAAAQVAAGIEIDGRFYGTTWSNSAGIGSQAEALAGGTEFPRTSQRQPLAEPELWITPDGRLAIHMPGPSPTGGIPAASVSPDSTLFRGGLTWTSFGADPDGAIEGAPLGAITADGSLPGTGWLVAIPEVGTTTLTVPDTSR